MLRGSSREKRLDLLLRSTGWPTDRSVCFPGPGDRRGAVRCHVVPVASNKSTSTVKAMATMRAVQVSSPGGDLEIVTRERRPPGPGQVEIRVSACGVCHSDSIVKEGQFPGLQFPRVPGHEVVGIVTAVGPGVQPWKAGERVGVGWHGGHCFICPSCRVGDFVTCREEKICGISYDGGYAEYMLARAEAVARVPQELTDAEAAPLMCAGITTFN